MLRTAFGAFDPDKPSCPIGIDRTRRVLVDACDPSRTFPTDGAGLRTYPTVVDGSHLLVNLNRLATTTTTSSATTTSG